MILNVVLWTCMLSSALFVGLKDGDQNVVAGCRGADVCLAKRPVQDPFKQRTDLTFFLSVDSFDIESIRNFVQATRLTSSAKFVDNDCVCHKHYLRLLCRRNKRSLESFYSATAGKYRVVIVSSRAVGLSTSDAIPSVGLPVYSVASDSLAQLQGGTPETVVINSLGVVEKVWRGAYPDTVKDGLEAHFNANAVGLSEQ